MAATAIAASGNANLTERRDGHMVVGLGGLTSDLFVISEAL